MRIALVLLAVTTLAHAETKAEKTAKLAVTVPDGWKLTVKDAGITGESKDKEVALLAWSVDAVDEASSKKKLESELYSAVASMKWDKATTTGKAHDLAITFFNGSGHAVGGDVAIKAAVVGPTAKKKALLVALAVKVDKLDAHKAEIDAILNSVAAAK
jgi:hypothetical protein